MIDYSQTELETIRRQLNDMKDRIGRPGFLEGEGVGNNYPSYVYPYDIRYEALIDERVRDLESVVEKANPGIQVTRIHLFEFAREYLKEQGLWEKSVELARTKGESFLFTNLPGTLNGKRIAEFFLKTALVRSPGLILVHGVGMAWPILRGHEVLKSFPSRIEKKIPIILFYPGTYDGKFLRPFGKFDDANEYQAIAWPY
jgi:hypothetical protein